jgi:hypothetical protein
MVRKSSCLVLLVCLWGAVSGWAQELRTESFDGQEVMTGEILVRFHGASEAQSRLTLALDSDVAFAAPVDQRAQCAPAPVGLELFFTSDARVIANVFAGAVDPSITYTPPAP